MRYYYRMTYFTESLDYTALVDEAMRDVVRKALQHAEAQGLDNDHHFYISFKTSHPGVELSSELQEQYPEEMTIVLQHQYWDLDVLPYQFSVMLSFNNVPEKLVVPYEALTAFADPGVRFGLQFHNKPSTHEDSGELLSEDTQVTSFEHTSSIVPDNAEDERNEEKVISLDAFRK